MWIRSGWLQTWQKVSWMAAQTRVRRRSFKVLADALGRTIGTGASAANIGHAVRTRYKGMFGGKPLQDLDMMEQALVPSATRTPRKPSISRSLFGASEQQEEPRFLRARLRRMGNVDVAAPQLGKLYTPEEAVCRSLVWNIGHTDRGRDEDLR